MAASSITPSAAGLRALSHPTRLKMLMLLRLEGPATATQLAQQLKLNTGATSYHLRQLAEHGFIEEDTERGDARDRWWKAAHESTRADLDSRTQRGGGRERRGVPALRRPAVHRDAHAVRRGAPLPPRALAEGEHHQRLAPPAHARSVPSSWSTRWSTSSRSGRRGRRRTSRPPGASWSTSTRSRARAPSSSRATTDEPASHPSQDAADPPLRLADRRGDLAARHPGLDDRDPVAGAHHHRLADPDRSGGLRRDHADGAVQGVRRPARRPGRPAPDGDRAPTRCPSSWSG